MSSKDLAQRIACLAGLCVATASWSAPASVCPAHAGTRVTQIDLFDGDPAEQVQLAPDDDRAGTTLYSVRSVYDAHRVLTIRCHYGAASEDITLAKPVRVCKYTGGDKHPALSCQ